MRATLAAIALAGVAAAAPYKLNLPNGFPNVKPGSPELYMIEQAAHGTLPDGALPKKLAAQTLGDFQVIAANEIFEVAYFTSLLHNITEGVPGYEAKDAEQKKYLIDLLTGIQAQEELHAIGANAILSNAGGEVIKPCEYNFGVTNLKDALATAVLFTDVVLGTLQDVQADTIADGDGALVPLISSIVGQEGEQVGFFRSTAKKFPSALPFLTRSAGAFAWSALNQNFIAPGSCPNPPKVPILDTLVAPKVVSPYDKTLTFMWDNKANVNCESVSLVYINQQNTPVVVKPKVAKIEGQMVTLTAEFPYAKTLMNSLTLVALTKTAGPFADVPSVAKASVAGPGLIEIF